MLKLYLVSENLPPGVSNTTCDSPCYQLGDCMVTKLVLPQNNVWL